MANGRGSWDDVKLVWQRVLVGSGLVMWMGWLEEGLREEAIAQREKLDEKVVEGTRSFLEF